MKKDYLNDTQLNIFGIAPGAISSNFNTLDKLAQLRTFAKDKSKLIEIQSNGRKFANTFLGLHHKINSNEKKQNEKNIRQLELIKFKEDQIQSLKEKLTFVRFGKKEEIKTLVRLKRERSKIIERKASKSDLRNKIKNKLFSYEIAANLAADNSKSPLFKSYLNTLECQKEIIQTGQTLTSKYCNNRFCYSCNRIRTAKLINNYIPVFESLDKEIFMVTLTLPNCTGEDLKQTISKMIKAFQLIKDSGRKLYQRKGTKNILTGFRKIECTYNYKLKNFHPHLHIVVTKQSAAEYIKDSWLKHFKEATEKAQDIRAADINSVKELFKYFTKFWESKKSRSNIKYKTDWRALDKIFCSIRGLRIFQTFGFEKNKIDESEEIDIIHKTIYNITATEEPISWRWDYESALNYIDLSTGEQLKEYYLNKKEVHTMQIYIGFNDIDKLPIKKRLIQKLIE
jgi:hypothetical protein